MLFVWLIYVGLLGYFGVVKNAAMRPPGSPLSLSLLRGVGGGAARACRASHRFN
jgi:hypothetical protein